MDNQSALRLDIVHAVFVYSLKDRSQMNSIVKDWNFLCNSEKICKSGRVRERSGRRRRGQGWVLPIDEDNTQSHKELSTQWETEKVFDNIDNNGGHGASRDLIWERNLCAALSSTSPCSGHRFVGGVSWTFPQNALGPEIESSISYYLGIFSISRTGIIFKLTKEKRRTFFVHLTQLMKKGKDRASWDDSEN